MGAFFVSYHRLSLSLSMAYDGSRFFTTCASVIFAGLYCLSLYLSSEIFLARALNLYWQSLQSSFLRSLDQPSCYRGRSGPCLALRRCHGCSPAPTPPPQGSRRRGWKSAGCWLRDASGSLRPCFICSHCKQPAVSQVSPLSFRVLPVGLLRVSVLRSMAIRFSLFRGTKT